MKHNHYQNQLLVSIIAAVYLIVCTINPSHAQKVGGSIISNTSSAQEFILKNNEDVFGTAKVFIENAGQYGTAFNGSENHGNILFGYEGFAMPVLFTKNGFIQLQRKMPEKSEEEREREERKARKEGKMKQEEDEDEKPKDDFISVEWLNANPTVEIITQEKTSAYHTYGKIQQKAYSYKKIIFRNIYSGIDIEYHFKEGPEQGFEYSFVIHPGADPSVIKMKFGGNIRSVKKLREEGLLVKTKIGGLTQSNPVSFYDNDRAALVPVEFDIDENIVSFNIPGGFDNTRTLVIDPFVSSTANLLGLNAGKAKDVDFDYAGNVYVTGGGSQPTNHSLAKYNAAGVLQWTFSGSLAVPSWTFGTYYGGWMVEKPTGNVFMGQGFNYPNGFQVIRLSTTGLYDNYITTANGNFTEAWKMFWSCNNGSPQILIAGGGINSDINFGVFAPPSTTVSSLNITGIPYSGSTGWAQDIADFVFDPANNDMYCIYGSLYGTPSLANMMYKNTAPYSAASTAWSVPSGYNTVVEATNRPYMVTSGLVDNSANMLWVNASYLYYWDGKNLKAFDKATGAGIGTPLVTAGTAMAQGGIIADACNNVFIGQNNGTIKVYNFNGSVFSDAPPDITIPGYTTKTVYDLAFNEGSRLLYASGDGFVASFDISSYCPNTFYVITTTPNCTTSTVTASVTPAPPPGSSVTYTLYNGSTQLAVNTTGVFSGLSANVTYSILATINLACSGTQATTTFTIPAPVIATVTTNTNCGSSTGSITITASGGSGSGYTYSINGVTFQAGNVFSGLPAGVYTVTVKDGNGCTNTKQVILANINGPTVAFTQTNADCGNNAGTVTVNASGGTAPYQYSINNGVSFQTGNFFTGLVAGQYTLVVKDANGCTNSALITITTSPAPLLTAIPAAATCGLSNGTITAFGSAGTAPLQYSINGNTFQAGTTFTGLAAGPYTVYVKDANGCIATVNVTVNNAPSPSVTATSTPAACNNINGTITANGTGGISPYQYSINGGLYQANNVFTGLAAGSYTVSIKDNSGCTSTVTVTVTSTNGPSVTATATASTCGGNTGTITAVGSGGAGALQYSIDGFTYQASGLFSAMFPGTYIVYVRDIAGCIGTTVVTVNATAGPSLTATTTSSSCAVNNGSITATGSGGTGALQYSIDGVTFQAGNVFTGLAPGDYTVYVQDANGCIKTVNVTVSLASGLAFTLSVIEAGCGASSGTITVIATGTATPFQYSINGVTYQSSNVFTNLAAGTYTVYVKDASGCIVTQTADIIAAGSTTLTVTTQDATCGGSNGVIIATGSGGVAPLQYSINGSTYQLSGTFINVAPGTYTVYVKDATGCIATEIVTIINNGTGPGISTFTVNVSNAYMCGDGRGKITNPRVNGANCNTCTFSLNFGPFVPNASQLFTNLVPGTYLVTAMDANGCTKTISVTIGEATVSTASAVVTGTTCNGNTGSITITGIGPNTPYHASISGIGGPWITFDPSTTFTGLAPGVYEIILSDDESFDIGPPIDPGNCLDTIYVTVPATDGPVLTVTSTNGTCEQNDGTITASATGTAPLDYSIDGSTFQSSGLFTGLGSGTYTVTVMDGNGCTNTKTVTITNPSGPTVTALVIDATCSLDNGTITATGSGGTAPLQYSINGFSFQSSNTFTGLAPGNYNLYVKDINNCYSYISITVDDTPLPHVTAFSIPASCGGHDGSIVAQGISGTAPYTFSIDGTVYQSSNIFTSLDAGFYTVYIKDASGCITTTGVSVTNTVAPTFTTAIIAATCGNSNGTITITASGGTPGYQYSLDGTTFQLSNVFSVLATGTYTVTVKDANGCLSTRTVLVGNTNGPQVLSAV
ncbi:MAG: SprB repeat-containing protein, partial [Ferruginibacter sp.]